MEYIDIRQQHPYVGQIVEVIVVYPAVYKGINSVGNHEFKYYAEKSDVLYWRIPDVHTYSYVLEKTEEECKK